MSRWLRSTLSGFFVVTALFALVLLAVVGHFGVRDLKTAAALVPAVVVGFVLSGPLRTFVDRGGTRPIVLGLSAIAAVVAIVEGLLG